MGAAEAAHEVSWDSWGCDTDLYPTNDPHEVSIHLTTSLSVTGSEALLRKLGEPREWVPVAPKATRYMALMGVEWGEFTN